MRLQIDYINQAKLANPSYAQKMKTLNNYLGFCKFIDNHLYVSAYAFDNVLFVSNDGLEILIKHLTNIINAIQEYKIGQRPLGVDYLELLEKIANIDLKSWKIQKHNLEQYIDQTYVKQEGTTIHIIINDKLEHIPVVGIIGTYVDNNQTSSEIGSRYNIRFELNENYANNRLELFNLIKKENEIKNDSKDESEDESVIAARRIEVLKFEHPHNYAVDGEYNYEEMSPTFQMCADYPMRALSELRSLARSFRLRMKTKLHYKMLAEKDIIKYDYHKMYNDNAQFRAELKAFHRFFTRRVTTPFAIQVKSL